MSDTITGTGAGANQMPKILAVDDSSSMRQMVAYTLRQAGYEVIEAGDGQMALDTAMSQQFSLVVSDINMPVMDGIELVRRLRSLAGYKFTPILMLTTESNPEKKLEGKAAGATGWLVKPFDPDKLVATVQRVLG
jgi:two-component system, chemotaxis family, chemotaxis protein CheY